MHYQCNRKVTILARRREWFKISLNFEKMLGSSRMVSGGKKVERRAWLCVCFICCTCMFLSGLLYEINLGVSE